MKYFITALSITSIIFSPFVFAENDSARDRIEEKKEERRNDDKKRVGPIELSSTQISCVKTAIAKREDGMIAGHTTYNSAIMTALSNRKTALLSAWDKPDTASRRVAVKSADRDFKIATQNARKTWNESRRSVWKTFTTERNTCVPSANGQVSSIDTGSSKSDSSL